MKTSILFFIILLSVHLAIAEVPESTWKALINRNIALTQNDGIIFEGELALVEEKTISIIGNNGDVQTIEKSKVKTVRAKVVSSESYFQNDQTSESPEHDTRPIAYQYYVELEELRGETISNQLDGDKHLYIIKVNLGFSKDDKNILNEIITRRTQILDKLLTWYSSQKAEYLIKIENREMIREQVRQIVNQIMTKSILDIRFTKFEILGE